MREPREATPPRLAFSRMESAEALGVSVDFFDEHVSHELRCVRRGRRRLYPVGELERWLERSAEHAGRVAAFCPAWLWTHRPVAAGAIAHIATLGALDLVSPTFNLPLC